MFSRRYDEAIRLGRECRRKAPDDPLLLLTLGWACGENGMCDSARSLALRAFDLSGHGYVRRAAKSGEFLDQFYADRQGKPIDAYQLAEAFELLHDATNAVS